MKILHEMFVCIGYDAYIYIINNGGYSSDNKNLAATVIRRNVMKTYNKSEIMKRAWRRFRGHSKRTGETFGQSLKWSWDQARSVDYILGEDVRDNEFKGYWAAHISGLNPQYGFSRTFVSDREKSRSSSRHAYYTVSVTLSPGQVYELCEKHDRKFVTIQKGEIVELSKDDVKNHFE